MGIYLNLASIVSAVCDATGDDTSDAQVKIRRLVNEKGPGFLLITNWPFMRNDISFSITTSAHKYSGASYLPESFKRVLGANLKDSNNMVYPLTEVSVTETYERWLDPDDNQGVPEEFCISRIESGYYEIKFNRLPDDTYTFQADIELKWTPATSTTASLVITDDYMESFSHFISMARARQQADIELYSLLKSEWWNPNDIMGTVLGRALKGLSSPLKYKQVTPPEPKRISNDYGE